MNKWLLALGVIFSLCMFTACGTSDAEGSSDVYQIYYLDEDGTGLVTEEYRRTAQDGEDILAVASDLLDRLQHGAKNDKYKKPVDPEVEITDCQIKETQLSLYFTAAYNKTTGLDEILSRAAVVKTLCQIEGVDFVEFYVEDQPLMISGNAVGMMSGDTFIDELNPSNATKSKDVVLYFAAGDGKSLWQITAEVTYSAAEPLAQLMVEKLIEGPENIEGVPSGNLLRTVPAETRINNVTIRDNICYLDLSQDFTDPLPGISSDATVYSIVNTLCELPNVTKVQFTVEGEQEEKYGDTLNFNAPFERNLDLIREDQ